MHEITAHGVPPGHMAPRVPERVVLVEEVILAPVVDEPVGIVHPVLRRREVELRPVELLVGRGRCGARRRGRRGEAQRQHGERGYQQAWPSAAGRTSWH